MPVTRMVPARPITKAPHQLVPLTRPFSGRDASTEAMAPPAVLVWCGWASLEERQVMVGFPAAHGRVPGTELIPLDLRVVVDVVAAGRLAERLAQDVIGHQLVGGVQQGWREGPDAAGRDRLGRHGVQVVAVRLARVQAAV